MPFLARVSFDSPFARAYFYEDGLLETFGSVKGAADYLIHDVFNKHYRLTQPAHFMIAAVWGAAGKKVAELFGYGDINQWPGNPEVYSWIFENGIYQPRKRNIACS